MKLTLKQLTLTVALLLAALAVVVATVVIRQPADGTGPAGPTSDLVACKAALRQQLRDAITYNVAGSPPPACSGLSDEQVQQLAYEVLDEELAR